jgi:hypothetical protein
MNRRADLIWATLGVVGVLLITAIGEPVRRFRLRHLDNRTEARN